jgi:hypothetical protein
MSTWVTYAQAARTVRVRPDLLRKWVQRGKVRVARHTKEVLVELDDVRACEREWRLRVAKGAN